MCGGLIGDDVDGKFPGALAAQDLWEDLGGVAYQADRQRLLVFLGIQDQLEGLIEIGDHLIEVALMLAALETSLVHVHDETGAAVEGDRQRLCAAHATAAAGQGESTGQAAAKALLSHGREGLEGALQDALGGDVDPRAGRHLAVHHQAFILELAEVLPVSPVSHEVGVSNKYTRCPLIGLPDAHRLAGLHQQGFIRFQILKGFYDGIKSFPAARCTAGAAVDHEVLGALGNLGVEVIHEHAQGRFGLPRLGGQFGSARRAYFAWLRHGFLSSCFSTPSQAP